ncbi:MAG: tetratricopeptide repeat protein [Pseudomonadales bacterium]|nr:tetratricopeptide repeat protein [Pseudomonadales bacterium]
MASLPERSVSRLRVGGMSRAGFMRCLLVLAAGAGLAHAGFADAREPLYGALDHSDLEQCETLFWSGQSDAASVCYQALLLDLSYPAQIRAEAMWALGDVKTANALFQSAVQSSPENPSIRVRWGELFMQTYQYPDAMALFEEAIALDSSNAYAHIGAAEALSQGGSAEEINTHIAAVMENFASPPGAQLRALIMMTRSALEQDQYDKAADVLAEAKELAGDENLPTMELSALEAALAFMTRQDPEPFIAAALAENPNYGDAYAIPGYFASITRHYAEAGAFYEKAVAIQPRHWEAQLELGQNYLRLNKVSEAIEHAEIAYQGDPFNPKGVNILRLLDTFVEDFVLVNYPDPPEPGTLPLLTLRLHKNERDILKDYARKLAEDSIALYSERYRFKPREPIIIEIYPNHEDFVVRSIGMPGVGILGVTFGYLFAMDSPSGHPEESYHWGTTLWHEMAHVFTLEATRHNVPRWFSEGISVFEEWRTGPTPGVKIPTGVLQAMAADKFLPIAELDDGFMRPSYENQVMVSYMQAGLVFDFIDQEYGFDKIVDILHQFPDGTRPATAIANTLGISVEDFDRHFKQFIDIQYGPLLDQLDVWIKDYQHSFSALEAEDWTAAVAAAKRAIFTYPDYVENDSPYIALARAYSRLGERMLEFETLETFWHKGGYAPRALMALAERYVEYGRLEDAVKVYTAVNYVEPFNEKLHNQFGDLLMTLDHPRQALEEYLVTLAMKPLDLAATHYRIASAYKALNDIEQTREHLMTALDIAPQYRPAQMLLLELSRQHN